MVGKVIEINASVAIVRIGREKMSCLECKGDCALAKGEPTVEVASRPGLCVGQVVQLADNRTWLWWLKASLFFLAFVIGAMASGAGLRAAGLGQTADKIGIGVGLLAGGLALWLAHRVLRLKRRYAIAEIVREASNGNGSNQ